MALFWALLMAVTSSSATASTLELLRTEMNPPTPIVIKKAAIAKKNGYKWVIDYTKENIVDEVKKITKGKGVPVVVDGVGKDTWAASLDCLQPRGLMVSFGNASGPVPSTRKLDTSRPVHAMPFAAAITCFEDPFIRSR